MGIEPKQLLKRWPLPFSPDADEQDDPPARSQRGINGAHDSLQGDNLLRDLPDPRIPAIGHLRTALAERLHGVPIEELDRVELEVGWIFEGPLLADLTRLRMSAMPAVPALT